MTGVTDSTLELAQWRRLTAEMYARARETAEVDPRQAWEQLRRTREDMFRTHPQSPLGPGTRARFGGLPYFPYDPAWRFILPISPIRPEEQASVTFQLPEGTLQARRFATVSLPLPRKAHLMLFWLEGYGGGLFLPFKDLTSGTSTYGGGRYLYDSIKGADLGAGPERIVLDFNFSYNPSCAYSPAWVCPLAPRENVLPVAVEAGERASPDPGSADLGSSET